MMGADKSKAMREWLERNPNAKVYSNYPAVGLPIEFPELAEPVRMEFKHGLQEDGYIYGYLFGSNGKAILDTGPVEYRITSAELWNGTEYIKCFELRFPQVTGNKARIRAF